MAVIINLQPLNDEDFDFMDEILSRFYQRGGMNLEALDGFLAALICSPEWVTLSQYFPAILGNSDHQEGDFASEQELQRFIACVVRHWNGIADQLFSGRLFSPLLCVDRKGYSLGNDWATGFMCGVAFCHDEAWQALMENEEYAEVFFPILALAQEHHPDVKLRSLLKPLRPKQRKQLISSIAQSVLLIYCYFSPHRRKLEQQAKGSKIYRYATPNGDCNAFCHCGVGSEYKHVCTKPTLH